MASVDLSRRALLAGLATFPLIARAEQGFSLSNAHLIVGDGREMDGGLRVEDGKIVEIGPTVTGGQDMKGQTLWPGVYNGGSSLGLYEIDLEPATHDESENSSALLPQARVVDAYNPLSALIPITRLGGVVANLVVPAGGHLIAGQAAWMRLYGDTTASSTLLAPAGLCIHFGKGGTGGGGPSSRMGVAQQLRDTLDANPVPDPPVESKKKKKEPPPPPEKWTAFQSSLHALQRRETKALLFADRASDILVAIEFAQQYKLDAILIGAAEASVVINELAAAHFPVLYGPVTTQPAGFDSLHVTCQTPALMAKAGIPFAFRDPAAHNLREAPFQAGIAVAYGLARAEALRALASAPAFWGLPTGTLNPGQEATFVASAGDPLQPRNAVTGLWFQGVNVPLSSRQTELYERFKKIE